MSDSDDYGIHIKVNDDGTHEHIVKNLKIKTVMNGFTAQCPSTGKVWAFERPATFTAFMEKWAVERKKEMGK